MQNTVHRHSKQGWPPGAGRVGGAATDNGQALSSWGDENGLAWFVVMVVQLCEYAKNHLIVHLKGVDWMLCELNPNKVTLKNLTVIQK